jgi:hypothetical protein
MALGKSAVGDQNAFAGRGQNVHTAIDPDGSSGLLKRVRFAPALEDRVPASVLLHHKRSAERRHLTAFP